MRRIVIATLLATGLVRGQPALTDRLWVDSDGRPNPAARELIAALLDIESRGLDPADYDAYRWQATATTMAAGQGRDDSDIAQFDAGLTVAFIEALSDLHVGRIDPTQLGYQLHLRQEQYDPTAVAGAALVSGRIADAFDQAEPRLA